MERTYVMLKPDAVKRNLIGKIISKFEENNFKITNIKMMTLNEEILKEHYAHLASKPFFPEIVEFMTSGPVVPMIVEGENAIKRVKELVGVTNPDEWAEGTIRKEFASSKMENCAHITDPNDPEGTAEIEINRFFK